ncbi:hypothetical protein NDU88_007513 [Pleurodeles waltl]|uniref:Uncharacterized protein n=1 Tax=Pleurodeles waltl TaxID=8319 RepID=A0AAV7SSQ3_PLEWA|nr:hypothetical protein NDU88_007513 [Pleurodeles waltl]
MSATRTRLEDRAAKQIGAACSVIRSRRLGPGRITKARSRCRDPGVCAGTDRGPAGGCPARAGPAETSRSQPCSIQCSLRRCAPARAAPVPVEAPDGHPWERPEDSSHTRDLRNLKQVLPPARKTGRLCNFIGRSHNWRPPFWVFQTSVGPRFCGPEVPISPAKRTKLFERPPQTGCIPSALSGRI